MDVAISKTISPMEAFGDDRWCAEAVDVIPEVRNRQSGLMVMSCLHIAFLIAASARTALSGDGYTGMPCFNSKFIASRV